MNSINKTYNKLFIALFLISTLYVSIKSMSEGYVKFDDSFLGKSFFIRYYNRLKLVFGDKVYPQIVVGENGWMEFTGESNLNDFENLTGFPDDLLLKLSNTIAGCHNLANQEGFTLLIVVAPNKASIYSDRVPSQIQQYSNMSRLDILNIELRSKNIPEILDLRPALRNESKKRLIYYVTDTHWNGYGAYIAYQEVIKTLSNNYPTLSPYPEKFYRIQQVEVNRPKDLAKTIQASYILEPSIVPQLKKNYYTTVEFPGSDSMFTVVPESDLPTLLMIHDSFGQSMKTFLSYNFSKALYARISDASTYLNRESIEFFIPDIVVVEVAERNMHSLLFALKECAPSP